MLRVPSPVLKVIEETVKPEELLQMRTLTVDYDMATRQLLVLGPVANHSEHQDVPLAGLICNAPALRELRVHEPVQNVYRLDLDWSKLTHFRAETGLGVQKPEDVLRVLARGAPSLQSVIVSASFRPPYTTNSNPDRDIITLPSLHTLSFALQFDVSVAAMHLQQGLNLAAPGADGGQEVGAQIQDLFDSICTPNLKHLTVRFGNVVDLHETHVAPQVPFVQLLLRSACRLESLDIGFVMTKESLIECLASVPTLKSLTIEECLWTVMRDRQRMAFLNHQNPATAAITLEAIAEHAILTDEFLQRFSPISEGGNEDPPTIPLCPELETLTLQKCESLSEMALVKFVQARAPPEPAQEGSAESGPTPPLPSSSTKPLRYLNAAFQREKGMITDVDMAARKEMKELKKAANVVISYPKNSIPPDLPHSGQHPPGVAFRSSAWRNLLWE
ncbi:hypothetical protein V5O48_011309 [Marasmius crinis-equi]|uniref:Uncharacterized protein n=1 Tax=Marasmius crinis-equi TaxID=585013 RepID=A0ABR3F610_9AGAR